MNKSEEIGKPEHRDHGPGYAEYRLHIRSNEKEGVGVLAVDSVGSQKDGSS